MPNYHLNCHLTCLEAYRCALNGYAGCYRHSDNSLNFKTANPLPRLIAHEFGHYLFHAYNGEGHKFEADIEACERYAKEVEYWYEKKSNPFELGDLLLGLAVTLGLSIAGSLVAMSIYEYFTHEKP